MKRAPLAKPQIKSLSLFLIVIPFQFKWHHREESNPPTTGLEGPCPDPLAAAEIVDFFVRKVTKPKKVWQSSFQPLNSGCGTDCWYWIYSSAKKVGME